MSTRIGEALRDLGDAIDAIESAGGVVTDVEPSTDGTDPDGAVELGFRVRLPLLPASDLGGVDLAMEGASLDDDGCLVLDVVAATAGTDAPGTGTAEPERDEDDGVGTDTDDRDGDQSADATPGDSLPAYRDPERLRAVYEAHDSFPRMTEALGVDVTPQTVRRHMIDHGIHDPGGRSGSGDEGGTGASDGGEDGENRETADPPDPSGDSDGAGREDPPASDAEPDRRSAEVPPAFGDLDGVDLDDLKEAVRTARTIHEVGQRLGVPRERAFRLLNALDLVDLVSGRLETADRPISTEELDQRIARATAGGE